MQGNTTNTLANGYIASNQTTASPGQNLPVLPVVMMLVFGAIGNIIAIVIAIYTSKSHKWSTFYRLVLALAVSDSIGLIIPLPLAIANYVNDKIWIGGQPLCDFMSFCFIFAGMASAMQASAMSFDRYLAVRHPIFYTVTLRRHHINCTMIILWIVAFLIACLPLWDLNENIHQFPGTWCFFNQFALEGKDKLFSYLYATMGIGMIVVMILLNSVVIFELIKRCRKKNEETTTSDSRISDVYNVVFLVVLMSVFTICWVPLMVRILINQSGDGEVDREADLLVMRLALTNQIVDPWVYIIFRKDMISACINIGKRLFNSNRHLRRRSAEDTSQRTGTWSDITGTENRSTSEMKSLNIPQMQIT